MQKLNSTAQIYDFCELKDLRWRLTVPNTSEELRGRNAVMNYQATLEKIQKRPVQIFWARKLNELTWQACLCTSWPFGLKKKLRKVTVPVLGGKNAKSTTP